MLKEIKTRAVVAPLPVLIIGTYDADGVADAMNVAWGGQSWDNEIAINISANHKTTENLKLQKAFTLHIGDESRVALSDFVGIISGKNEPKLEHVDATIKHGEKVNAPIIEEFVLVMECEVVKMEDNGHGGCRVVGRVVRTVADESVLDADGKVDFSKLRPIVYDSEKNAYRGVTQEIAEAFEEGKTLI